MNIAVIGLGEAGQVFASGLADRGASVVAYDPAPHHTPSGVKRASSANEAVRAADIVLSAVGARAAETVAAHAFPLMGRGQLFVDLNTSSPEQKKLVARRSAESGVLFADVAIMAPVNRAGIDTPCLVSGTGAPQFASLSRAYGLVLENVGAEAGAAAGLKLLRSVFMKGLAALVFESLSAGRAAGSETWILSQITEELDSASDGLVERLVAGTLVHAERREHEMRDARAYLDTLGSPAWMTDGAVKWLHSIAEARAQDALIADDNSS